jgi:hypothetical protein
MGNQPVAGPLSTHRTTQTKNKRKKTSLPWVGLKPMIPTFEEISQKEEYYYIFRTMKNTHELKHTLRSTDLGCQDRHNRYQYEGGLISLWLYKENRKLWD